MGRGGTGRGDRGRVRRWLPHALAVVLLGAGSLHFLRPATFDALMPRPVPAEVHRAVTYGSGVAELVAGTLLLVPRTRRVGGWAAFLVFLGVYPANVDAALRGGMQLPGLLGTPWVAWARLPLQLPLLWGAWQVAHDPPVAHDAGED